MSIERNSGLLARLPFFQALTEDELKLVAFGAQSMQLRPGQVLFREGEPADAAYLVVSGGLELRAGTGEGSTAEVVRAGSLIGALSLIIDMPRPATAMALASAECLWIRRSVMRRVFEEYPDSAIRLRAQVAEQLKGLMSDLQRARKRLYPEA